MYSIQQSNNTPYDVQDGFMDHKYLSFFFEESEQETHN